MDKYYDTRVKRLYDICSMEVENGTMGKSITGFNISVDTTHFDMDYIRAMFEEIYGISSNNMYKKNYARDIVIFRDKGDHFVFHNSFIKKVSNDLLETETDIKRTVGDINFSADYLSIVDNESDYIIPILQEMRKNKIDNLLK